MLWIMRSGAPWRDLPGFFGPWQTTYDRFRGWTRNGLWAAMLGGLSASLRDDGALMVDSTAMRVHAHGANPAGGQLAQAMGRSRSSLSTKIHMACDALGYPLGFVLTGANVSDFDQAKPLLKVHLHPAALAIMDKGYDSDAIRAYVNQLGGVAVIAGALFYGATHHRHDVNRRYPEQTRVLSSHDQRPRHGSSTGRLPNSRCDRLLSS